MIPKHFHRLNPDILARIKDVGLSPDKFPEHIAVIMDGNGRFAREHGWVRSLGHQEGVKTTKKIVTFARELGIRYLTLYAFSEENWRRPRLEIAALMKLLKNYLKSELEIMMTNEIRLHAIGEIEKLEDSARRILLETIEKTKNNDKMVLTLSLSYSSRGEILRAVDKIRNDNALGKLSEETFSGYLDTASMPDPDLLIRTSGEMRVSNFLLWQIAYSEIYVTDTLWPAFSEDELLRALLSFQNRSRRYGGIDDFSGPQVETSRP